MAYETSGTLSSDKSSPTDKTITIDNWSNVSLQNLIDDNGVIRLPITNAAYPQFPYQETLVESYQNPEPHPSVSNPVLTASDVTDQSARFVADPFLYAPDSEDSFSDWQMFFEIARDDYGVIGHATSSDKGVTWNYNQTVIDSGWHLAFPLVWRWDGSYYMMPAGGDRIPLYKASESEFPTTWNLLTEQLIDDRSGYTGNSTDTTIFRWDDTWWLFDNDNGTDLYIYYNDGDLETGSWSEHANNPVITGDETQTRPAGRPIVRDDHIVVYYQDTVSEYGDKVRAWSVDTLTTSSFSQSEFSTSPILEESGSGWNSDRMHHYDPWWVDGDGRWVATVDGYNGSDWSIGVYHVPTVTDFTAKRV